MSVPAAQLPFEEQIAKLSGIARDKGDDFRIRLHRRSSSAAPLESIATLSAARVEHLSQPETWIPALCGGGTFILAVMHEAEPSMTIATLVPATIAGAPREVDFDAVLRPGWQGPGTLLFPKRPGAVVAPDFFGTQKPGGGVGGNGGPRDPSPTAHAAAGPSPDAIVEARLALMREQMQGEMRELHRGMENISKSSERQIASVLEVVKTIAQRPAEPQKSLVDQVGPLLAAAAPIVTAILQKSGEERKLAIDAQARAEERMAALQAESTKMLLTMSEKAATASTDMMKMVQPMVDGMAMMGRSLLQQVATMQELTAPPPEDNGWMGILKEGVRAFAEYQNAQAAMRQPAQPPQAALPPAPQPATAPVPPMPDSAEGAEGNGEADPTVEQIAAMDPNALAQAFEVNLRAKNDPAEIAETFKIALAANAGFAQGIAQAGGPIKFFQARLGTWLTEEGNPDYVRAVVGQLVQRGVKVA